MNKDFYKNTNNLLLAAACFILAVFHIWQYFHSGYMIHCMFRAILYTSLLIILLIFGKKGIALDCILFAFIVTWLNDFVNFTGFFVLLLSCKFYRQLEKPLIILYVMNICIAYMVRGFQISHLVIHLTTCFLFFMIYFIANKRKPLELTEDERAILEELRGGKLQKEIDLFSKNIITKKLNEAKAKNKVNTTEELLSIYTKELEIQPCD